MRHNFFLVLLYSSLFSQQVILKQSTLSTSAVNATGEGVRLTGALGQLIHSNDTDKEAGTDPVITSMI